MVPQLLVNQLYSLEHDGHDASSYDDIMPYLHSPIDLNDNGILDYRLEFTVLEENGRVAEFTEKITRKAEADGSDNDNIRVNRIVFNGDGSFIHYSTQNLDASQEDMQNIVSDYASGKHKHNLKNSGRLLRRLLRQGGLENR